MSSALGQVQGVANTVSGLVRTLYQTRTDIDRAQLGAAIAAQRDNATLAAETIRARQLAAAAATPPIFGSSLGNLMPLLVLAGGVLLLKRFAS